MSNGMTRTSALMGIGSLLVAVTPLWSLLCGHSFVVTPSSAKQVVPYKRSLRQKASAIVTRTQSITTFYHHRVVPKVVGRNITIPVSYLHCYNHQTAAGLFSIHSSTSACMLYCEMQIGLPRSSSGF